MGTIAGASTSKTAKAAHDVGVVAKIERSGSATAWLWGVSLAVLASGSGLFLLLQEQMSRPAIERKASTFSQDSTASIILNQNSKNCRHRLFDNQTGRFTDATTPCPPEIPLDAKGHPVPMGTVHTMNEISKSFR